MLCVLAPPKLAYCSGAFGNGRQLFRCLPCKTATTEFTVMSFVCFVRPAEFSLSSLLLPRCSRALRDEGRLRAHEEALILLSLKVKAKTAT